MTPTKKNNESWFSIAGDKVTMSIKVFLMLVAAVLLGGAAGQGVEGVKAQLFDSPHSHLELQTEIMELTAQYAHISADIQNLKETNELILAVLLGKT